MEFMDGICKTRECAWDVLLSESMKDQEATVEGAIHSIRNMGDVAFVILRKKEGLFQTVYENDKTNVSIHDLKEAMCVRLTGTLHEEERAPHGRELRISHVEILSSPAEPLPLAIDKWKLNTSLEAKLNYRPIALRNVQERAKFKIQEALVRAFRDYLYEKGITEIDILHENKAKELHFNSANEWLYTTWDVREREIQDIATKVLNDNPGFKIDDIDYKESADGSEVYIFELEKGNQEIHVTVNMEGNVVK